MASLWAVLGQLLIAVLGMALVFLTFAVLYIHHQHRRFAHIPGPPLKSFFVGHLADVKEKFDKGSFFGQVMLEWVSEYGQTFCTFFFHRAMVFTIDPETVKEVLIGKHVKSRFAYEDIAYVYGERFMGKGLVTETDHASWNERRKLLNPAFHRKTLKGLMDAFNETSDDLMEKLQDMAENKEVISLCEEMHHTTLDVIGKVAFGKDIDSLHNDQSPFPSAIKKAMAGISKCLKFPLHKYLPVDRKFKSEVREACRFLRNTGKVWIAEREAAISRGECDTEDIMTFVIHSKANVKDDPMEKVLDDFVTFFIAGQETTANTLSFLLMEIGRRPDVFQKLQEEIDSVIGQKASISFDDLSNLEYASMILKETLRLYPPATLTFRTTSEDMKIQGYSIPKGTSILVSMYASGRAPDLHRDPETFNAERFQQESPDRPTMYSYFPFSLGTRSCIGQTFAQIEAKVILAKFMQHFEMDLDPKQSFDVEETLTLKPKGGTMATLTLRSQQ